MKRFDSSRPEFLPYGFTCEIWTPARMARPDRHNEVEFNLLTAGSLTYLFGGRRTTVDAGRLAIFWAAIPHQIVAFDGQAPYFVVTLPLSEFLELGVDLNVVNRMLRGELLVDDDTDNCDRLKFEQWESELREGVAACERAVKLEVQARLLRFSRAISDQPTAGRNPDPSLSRADQLACHIARHYHEPLTSRSVAAW